MRDIEEELEVVARQRTMLAHDLGDPVDVLRSDVAQSFDVVNLASNDLHAQVEPLAVLEQRKGQSENVR